ncbi:uncharacterized protein BX664DRAFT_322605, partial [Halteromyces radiatus]|uniref:uncharacterized protein n=1 Tax=Halteromyces radiatus TaxID=101107 RepID=UPI00221E6538
MLSPLRRTHLMLFYSVVITLSICLATSFIIFHRIIHSVLLPYHYCSHRVVIHHQIFIHSSSHQITSTTIIIILYHHIL